MKIVITGGNGYIGSDLPGTANGDGGNGGMGIWIEENCSNCQVSNCNVTNTGTGGTKGGAAASDGVGGHGSEEFAAGSGESGRGVLPDPRGRTFFVGLYNCPLRVRQPDES